MNIDADRLALTQQLHALLVDYWHDVDTNWGRLAPDYFTPDGLWVGENSTFEGREGVRAFYQWREKRGNRVVFHSVQNLRAIFDGGPDKALCQWVMVLHGGDGTPPIATNPPILIDYMTERWVLTDEGWKINHRSSNVLFKGGALLPRPELGVPHDAAAAQ
ncbi:nuclear transport factor 2 family protein [Desertimonas flava]|uniref:nuclear transport factor 2 family protein n=1 Tax=Desertimonas flava TaxID=2064846 RepID=UPI0013C3E7B1|nr:nuclear transport factor 2 family protein [Desertimonas flava]